MSVLDVDIVIPVFNEGENIIKSMRAIREQVKSDYRILICYDSKEDPTLEILAKFDLISENVLLVENLFRGVHGAIRSGFKESNANAVITFMADDDYNAGLIDKMIDEFKKGNEIVAPSRFIQGGIFSGCPWLKRIIVIMTSWSMHSLAGIPVHDATNGFRLFSRRLLENCPLESTEGFTYSVELLVKCHRLGWKMTEVPAKWFERTLGKSRFRLFGWANAYLHWYWYAFGTRYLRRHSL